MDKIELPLLKGKDTEKCIPFTVVVGLGILIFILAIACLSLNLKKEYKLHYDEMSNLDYKVYLKENNFYKEKYLEKDQMYIASLIDYIDTDFNYSFMSAENVGLEYTYYIESTLQINDTNGKNIYEDTETLIEQKKFNEMSDNAFRVNEKVRINYTKYDQKARSFIDEYGITADAKLLVKLHVGLQGKHQDYDKKITEMSVMTLEIPLANKTLQIELDYDVSNKTDAVLQYKSAVITNPVVFYFTVMLAVLDVIAIIAIVIFLIKMRDPEVKYQKRLERILKDYSRYITETAITQRAKDLMKTRSLRIELVKTFEGLMDIRDNLSQQILFHEERAGEEAIFYIITEKVGFVYIMKVEDFK